MAMGGLTGGGRVRACGRIRLLGAVLVLSLAAASAPSLADGTAVGVVEDLTGGAIVIHAGAARAGMLDRCDLERIERDEFRRDRMADRAVQRRRLDRAEIEQGADDVGAADAISALRHQPLEVARAVDHDPVEHHVAALRWEDDVHRIVVGSRDSPQPRRRPM